MSRVTVRVVQPRVTVRPGTINVGGGAVSSVFGRTGAVVADGDDYAAFYQAADLALAALVSGNLPHSLSGGDTFTVTDLPSPTNPHDAANKAYVDALVANLLELQGDIACAANPNYPAASKGDAYYVTSAGKIGGASGKSVDVGDVVVAKADNAGGTEASVGTSWFVLEHNIDLSGYVPTTRMVSTTSPLAGGGALSGNLTLSVSAGTDTVAGVLELATPAEVVTGTDTARAVTPAGVAAVLADRDALIWLGW